MRNMAFKKGRDGKIIAILLLLAITVSVPLAAFGVSYPPSLFYKAERHDTFIKGDVVYLFHSGTDDIKKTIHVGDTLAVFRTTPSCQVVPIGIIKVLSFVGETYLRGEVFAGEIKPDDIAKKGAVSCLVISAGMCGE